MKEIPTYAEKTRTLAYDLEEARRAAFRRRSITLCRRWPDAIGERISPTNGDLLPVLGSGSDQPPAL